MRSVTDCLPDFAALVNGLYQGTFGRSPDATGLAHYVGVFQDGATVAGVLRAMLASNEFRQKSMDANVKGFVPLSGDPALPVQLDLAPVQLRRLWAHVARTWSQLGEQDPYWSVITDPRWHLANMAEAEVLDAFYGLGQGDLARMRAWFARQDIPWQADWVCAEYGCGVGRMTEWLAASCARVHAFDISAAHLTCARQRLGRRGVDNVTFHKVVDMADLEGLAGMDVFYSVMVLQHNPPPVMQAILDRALALLNPGGYAFFQLPTYSRGYSFDLAAYGRGMDQATAMEMHCLPQQAVFALAEKHGCVALEVQQDGYIDNWGVSHSFLLHKHLKAERRKTRR